MIIRWKITPLVSEKYDSIIKLNAVLILYLTQFWDKTIENDNILWDKLSRFRISYFK